MSSIEKAMDKLAGRDSPADSDETESPDDAAAGTVDEAREVAEAVVGAAKEPVPESDAAAATAGEPQPAPPPAVPAAAPPATGDDDGRPDQQVHIDFDALQAAGFLTPLTGLTREAEEYQHIKRRLLGNIVLAGDSAGRPSNLIMITSSVPGEGKTYTSMNLTMSISMEMDHTVLVVDTDLMKRDLSRYLNLVDRPGLFDYLNETVDDVSEIIYRTNRSNLAVIPAGRYTSASTELLASVRMKSLVAEFASRYHDRVVLFDTPPLLATTTAVALAPYVGQLVLVVEAGETRSTTLQEALRVIDRTPITGLILNKAKAVTSSPYDYYGYYYRGVAEDA